MSLRTRKNESVTFRIDSALKADLSRLAAEKHQTLGSFIRKLVEQRIAQEQRRKFETEAGRQSRAAAALANDPSTDEHAFMQELESDLKDFGDEWK